MSEKMTRKLTYDINWWEDPPTVGQYMVTIGRKGIGTVYLLKSIRQVKQKSITEYIRYAVEVMIMPGLKELTEFEMVEGGANVWVRGEEAWPMFWNPRKKKK